MNKKPTDLGDGSRDGGPGGATVGGVVGARVGGAPRVGGACWALGHKASHGLTDACRQDEVLPQLHVCATFGCN